MVDDIRILESFEEALKILEGDKYATLHLTLIYVNKLKNKCVPAENDTEPVRLFKAALSANISKTVEENLTIYHKIALFLFPPANKLLQYSEEEKRRIKTKCEEMMTIYMVNDENTTDSAPQVSSNNMELLRGIIDDSDMTYSVADKINEEISQYQNVKVKFTDDFDMLKWWDAHKLEYPNLYKLSCKLLATPASSAPSERIFSMARNLICEKRSGIAVNYEKINEMMFVHVNDKNNL